MSYQVTENLGFEEWGPFARPHPGGNFLETSILHLKAIACNSLFCFLLQFCTVGVHPLQAAVKTLFRFSL